MISQRLERTAALVVIAAMAGTIVVLRLNRGKQAEQQVGQMTEAHQLENQGVEVIAIETVANLEKQVSELTASNSTLQDALRRAQKASQGSKVVQVVNASTGPIQCEKPTDVQCLLPAGGVVRIDVQEVQLQTKAGNKILVGTAEAWRLEPTPAKRLAGGPFSAEVTEAGGWPGDLADVSKWGFGLAGFYSGTGFVPGLALAAPPFKVFGWEIDPMVSAGWGVATASVLVRP